jgi:hypothetical protein
VINRLPATQSQGRVSGDDIVTGVDIGIGLLTLYISYKLKHSKWGIERNKEGRFPSMLSAVISIIFTVLSAYIGASNHLAGMVLGIINIIMALESLATFYKIDPKNTNVASSNVRLEGRSGRQIRDSIGLDFNVNNEDSIAKKIQNSWISDKLVNRIAELFSWVAFFTSITGIIFQTIS